MYVSSYDPSKQFSQNLTFNVGNNQKNDEQEMFNSTQSFDIEAEKMVQDHALESRSISTPSQFETYLAKAKAGESLPAPIRLALYICSLELNSSRPDLASIPSFFSSPFSIYVTFNLAGAAILFDELLKGFERILAKRNAPYTLETLPIDWFDLTKELPQIKEAVFKSVKNASKAEYRTPCTRIESEQHYSVKDGCASFDNCVIDHEGKLLEVHPWETFYKTGLESDKRLAQELSPKVPQELKIKFDNRTIIQKRGYSVNLSAEKLCMARNWGLVSHLIEEDKNLSPSVGFKVLKLSISAKNWDICEKLFKAGLPIYDKQNESYWPLLSIIECCRVYKFPKILEFVEKHACGEASQFHQWNFNAFKHVVGSLCIRYEKLAAETITSANFSDKNHGLFLLSKMWVAAQHPNYKNYYDVPDAIREKCKYEFYRCIISCLSTMPIVSHPFYINFKKGLQDIINEFEKKNIPFSESQIEEILPEIISNMGKVTQSNKGIYCLTDEAVLESREVVSEMDYSFECNVEDLCLAKNFGLVITLFNGKISEEIAFRVMNSMIRYDEWDICEILYKNGFPIRCAENSSYETFYNIIRDCDSDNLSKILKITLASWKEIVKLHPSELQMFENIANIYSTRICTCVNPVIDKQKEIEVLEILTKMWIYAHYSEYDELSPDSVAFQEKIVFFKNIISNFENPHISLETLHGFSDIEQLIREEVKGFEENKTCTIQ